MAENMQVNIDSIRTPVSKFLMKLIIGADGRDKAYNMAPSFHVLSSLICIFGFIRRKEIHVAVRVSAYSLCSLIILSTLFVKQHYFLDVVFALSLGFIIYFIFVTFKPGDIIVDKYPNFLVINRKHKKQIGKRH